MALLRYAGGGPDALPLPTDKRRREGVLREGVIVRLRRPAPAQRRKAMPIPNALSKER